MADDFNRRIERYLDELYRWNDKMNLTTVLRGKAADVLVTPSLAMAEFLEGLPEGARVCDIGAGGGIPGIVLALRLPALSFSLVESNVKKSVFLSHVASELGLSNVAVVNRHTESMRADAEFAQAADAVVARAVNRKHVFEAAEYLLKPGGLLLVHRSEHGPEMQPRFAAGNKNEFVESYILQ